MSAEEEPSEVKQALMLSVRLLDKNLEELDYPGLSEQAKLKYGQLVQGLRRKVDSAIIQGHPNAEEMMEVVVKLEAKIPYGGHNHAFEA